MAKQLWGIIDQNGNSVFDVDSFTALKFDDNSKISSFPVENGAFASYNKVITPYKIKIKLSVGGSRRMESFLLDLANEIRSINLYTIITPEIDYVNANLVDYSYSRESGKGQGMITAELTLEEIRQVTPQYTTVALPAIKVKNPGSASKLVNCHQQPQPPKQKSLADMSLAEINQKARNDAGLRP